MWKPRSSPCAKEPGARMNKPITDLQHPKMLLDPYGAWAAAEGVPVTEDFGVDLLAVATAPWPRFGTDGAIVHLKGRGDFMSLFVVDLPPGGKIARQRHLYEEVIYVLSGSGSTKIEIGRSAPTASNGDRTACSRCRSTPPISTSTPRARAGAAHFGQQSPRA